MVRNSPPNAMVSNMVCRFIDHLEISRLIITVGLVYYLLWGFHHLHNDLVPYDEHAVVNMGSMGKTFHLRCRQGRESAFHMDLGVVFDSLLLTAPLLLLITNLV